MKTYLKYLSIMGLVVSLALFGSACSSGGASDDDDGDDAADEAGDMTGITTVGTSVVSGDYTPGVSMALDSDGSMKATITAVDVDGDGTVGTPSLTGVTVSSGDARTLVKGGVKATLDEADVTCGERDVGSGDEDDAFDIAVSLDTTGSMGAAAGILASKVSEFATALADAGVDAQFAGITVGDAYATKASSSEFTDDVSTGDLGEPPDFDECERPDTGAALISATDMSTFFDEVETVVGTGCNGNGGTENYLGPIQFGNDELEWRDGSSRVMITIGDNCAYTPDTQDEDDIVDPFSPPDPDDLIDDLTGNGTIVHVVGNDLECGDSYNMPDLAEATGGTFSEIGSCGSEEDCEVDLTELPITSSITSGIVGDCATTCELFESLEGTYTFFFTIDMVDGGTTFTAVLAVVITITLSC